MAVVGIHASHEQIAPSALLQAMREAEAAGFERAWSSDHFSPWSERQGESGFAWSWLGAAMQATAMPYGVVNAPGQRYHPAIVAQAAATLCELFPGRLSVALGTGEFSNEHITGEPWPNKIVRNARLRECVDVMRALFAGEEVDHYGLVRVDRARLWTLPAEPPPLLATAVSVETAGWAGEWADGLITIQQPREHLERMLDAFGGRGPVAVQVHVCWAPSEEEARRIAHDQWRTMVLGPPLSWDLATVEEFDLAGRHVRPEDLDGAVLISSDLARHTAWIQELVAMGFDAIYLHHVGQEQRRFIEAFGEHVLPAL
jgi:probable non-F420 flavinoid oxidoreductase